MPYTVIGAVAQGYSGAPGYTRLKFEGSLDSAQATSRAAAMRTWMQSWAIYLPSGASYTWESTCKVYTDSGVLQSEFPLVSPPSPLSGGGSGPYAGGVGAMIQWNTGTVHGGRKVRGRTYLIPLSNLAFQSDGSLDNTFAAAVATAGNVLLGGTPGLVINSRQASGGSAGPISAPVISCSVPDHAAVLRSRRR
jgi:hypothetical protein